MILSDLKTGESAVITRVRGRGAFRKRIIEMLIPPLEEQNKNNITQYSRWDFVAK